MFTETNKEVGSFADFSQHLTEIWKLISGLLKTRAIKKVASFMVHSV